MYVHILYALAVGGMTGIVCLIYLSPIKYCKCLGVGCTPCWIRLGVRFNIGPNETCCTGGRAKWNTAERNGAPSKTEHRRGKRNFGQNKWSGETEHC